MSHPVITQWHRVLRSRDTTMLDALLDDGAVFHSPVVHTPQTGKAITKAYLAAAFVVLANDTFRYVREIVGDRDAALEFEVELDGTHINGIDLIRWNDDDLITDFKVMIRPLKAINLVHEKMAVQLRG